MQCFTITASFLKNEIQSFSQTFARFVKCFLYDLYLFSDYFGVMNLWFTTRGPKTKAKTKGCEKNNKVRRTTGNTVRRSVKTSHGLHLISYIFSRQQQLNPLAIRWDLESDSLRSCTVSRMHVYMELKSLRAQASSKTWGWEDSRRFERPGEDEEANHLPQCSYLQAVIFLTCLLLIFHS